VTPLHGAAAAHHHASPTSREFNLGEAAPVGDDGEAIDDLNQGGVIGREWQIGGHARGATALTLPGSRRHVLHRGSRGWQGALNEARWIARRQSLNRWGRWRRYAARRRNLRCVAARTTCRITRRLKGTTGPLL
jgi:hypothetical protein